MYDSQLDSDELYIYKEVIKLGQQAFKKYNQLYENMPSCKQYLTQDEMYQNCMIEKMNYCLEQIIMNR